MTDLERRTLLKVAAGLAGGGAGTAQRLSQTGSKPVVGGVVDMGSLAKGVAEHIHTAQQLSDLSEPDTDPAVAIVDDVGVLWYDFDKSKWVVPNRGDSNHRYNAFIATLDTEQINVTNETFIRATRGTDSSSTASNSWINAFDGASKDISAEFDEGGNARFKPDETGEYKINVIARFEGNTSAGDEVKMRVRDVTNGSTVGPVQIEAHSSDTVAIRNISITVELTAGVEYEIQVSNTNSSFVVKASDTIGTIERVVVG